MSDQGKSEATPGVMDRVKFALGTASLPQVADALGEPLSTVKSWSARDAIPLGALKRIKAATGRSIDWLVYGEEVRFSSDRSQDDLLKSESAFAFEAKSEPAKAGNGGHSHAASPPPPSYGDDDAFSKRLATAMDIVEAGLAAKGVDASKVPRAEMAAAVFRLLPWPVPKVLD